MLAKASQKVRFANEGGDNACVAEGCKQIPDGKGKRYCSDHYNQLLNGAELTLKNGRKRSFPHASSKHSSSKGVVQQKPWNKKARLVSLTTLDGDSVQAEMNEDQLQVFQAALVGAKFSAENEGAADQLEDDEEEDASFSAIREIIGFEEQ